MVQETVSQGADPMERTIDFAALQRINPEIVGWLYVPQIGVTASHFNRTDGHGIPDQRF